MGNQVEPPFDALKAISELPPREPRYHFNPDQKMRDALVHAFCIGGYSGPELCEILRKDPKYGNVGVKAIIRVLKECGVDTSRRAGSGSSVASPGGQGSG